MLQQMLLGLALSLFLSLAEPGAELLGRSPVENITSIVSARFVSTDIDDVLAEQSLGTITLSAGSLRPKTEAKLYRLVLLRLAGQKFVPVWQSEPLLSSNVPAARLGATPWTVCDLDRNGLSELLLFGAESCVVVSFGSDSIRKRTVPMPGAWPVAAVVCDLEDDSVPEIATLELSPLDSSLSARLVRLYDISDSAFVPRNAYALGLRWEQEPILCGACRLEEYWGVLPVLARVYPTLQPSVYAVLTRQEDSLLLTTTPFPWRNWFSKEQVLAAGPLSLFNVGDTLVAYGFFVPGLGTTGKGRGFAALQDGEWRLLRIIEEARGLSGPVCRFTLAGKPGWLELRENLFRFYPGEIFHWR